MWSSYCLWIVLSQHHKHHDFPVSVECNFLQSAVAPSLISCCKWQSQHPLPLKLAIPTGRNVFLWVICWYFPAHSYLLVWLQPLYEALFLSFMEHRMIACHFLIFNSSHSIQICCFNFTLFWHFIYVLYSIIKKWQNFKHTKVMDWDYNTTCKLHMFESVS